MDDKATSISGSAIQEIKETTEPVAFDTSSLAAANGDQITVSKPPPPPPPRLLRESSTSSLPPPAAPPAKKLPVKRVTSAANSPNPSRESSPVRPLLKLSNRSAPGPGRSRKNSLQELSPARSASSSTNPPSAAATQRALCVASTPVLHPVSSDPTIRAPIPQRLVLNSDVKEKPRWPTSPRIRTPPPLNKPSISAPRKFDQDPPLINVQRSTPVAEQQEAKQVTTDSETEDSLLISGMRTPARGVSGASSTLETVQEISQPNTPGLEFGTILEKVDTANSTTTDNGTSPDDSSTKTIRPKRSIIANESGSESGGRGDIKMRSTSAAPPAARPNGPATKTFTGVGRGKPSGEGSARNMTVETETVSSIPQVAVGGPVGAGNNGSIRTKPSSETIRPKKEKKKTARKAPSVNSGIASSKADIFEAKVANAVDEANSSDSEETFVYESNPPDISDRPRRFHSRTPSATSMASQVDQRRTLMDGHHSVAMKKSMKFANSYNSNGNSQQEAAPGEDDGSGTARSNMGTGRGTTHHHHIGGRWGRGGGNGHASLFDNESPFPNAAKSKAGNTTARLSSRPESPRLINTRTAPNGRKSPQLSSGYDLDDGADDERTPLISTVRSSRSARARRPAPSMRQMEHQSSREERSFLARFAGCLVLTIMISLVMSGAVGFMFATTQPLTDVKILALKNIIASEQDVILDMKVQARNPNLVVVTIDTADLVIFAKSSYAGTDQQWWKRPLETDFLRRVLRKRDDDPFDPPLDDPDTEPNLEIGHVGGLYSPLTFEGSPFRAQASTSLGQLRIINPGNETIPAGSKRWGRIVQHEFDLIVQGTLKYTLPLSPRTRSVSVKSRVRVKPNAADQDPEEVHTV
ncbi:hypothetical protein LZ554_007495 [Drepanopeziza brunnea f. sp. 'monogermtubi']|nr:hypothetical protein LZ554_007495 [Drepanopeziza brunnea f. sp. 'monogermtubi']